MAVRGMIDGVHWRDSARPVKFFVWDASTVFPFVGFLLYMRWWTFWFALATMFFFTILNRYGFSIAAFGRYVRTGMAGSRKLARPWWLT